jgi:hypothetical protein
MYLKETGWEDKRQESSGSGQGTMMDSCEHVHTFFSSVNGKKIS